MDTARELVAVMQRLAARGLSPGRSGNASARIAGGLLVTPTGVAAERLEPGQMVAIDLDGRPLDDNNWRPSSEWPMHAEIYRQRPDVQAIVHCHSRHATALACCGRDLPDFHYMTAALGGTVRCADYALFGTTALAGHALRALQNRHACLLANHGQVTLGQTPGEALERAELLEELAATFLLSQALGGPQLLDTEAMAAVTERFSNYGQQPAVAGGAQHTCP